MSLVLKVSCEVGFVLLVSLFFCFVNGFLVSLAWENVSWGVSGCHFQESRWKSQFSEKLTRWSSPTPSSLVCGFSSGASCGTYGQFGQ